jgi:hypothetical protein
MNILNKVRKEIIIIRSGHIPFWDNHRTLKGYLEKQCNKHHIWFPEEDSWLPCSREYFYKANNKHDKLSPTCIECDKKRSQKNKHDNPVRTLEHSRKQYKKRTKYFEERNIREREYLKNNLDRFYENNPDKAKEYAQKHRQHDISTKEWIDCLKYFDYSCAYCGVSEEESKKKYGQRLHKDHKDSDGYNDLRNAVPSCRRCNDKKLKKVMEEWFKKQDFFSIDKLNKIIKWCNEDYKSYIENKPPYRIGRQRIHKEDGSWNYIHVLWTVDEKRNMIECIAIGNKKKELLEKAKLLINKVS